MTAQNEISSQGNSTYKGTQSNSSYESNYIE